MLSNYCKEIVDWHDIKVGGVKKLIPNLNDKVKYTIHYKNLQHYLSLGMKLVEIHKVLSFKQSNFFKKLLISILIKEKKMLMNLVKGCIN